MSGLDVEALLDSTANAAPPDTGDNRSKDYGNRHKSDRDRHRDGSHRDRDRRQRDRSRDRVKRDKDVDGDVAMESPRSERTSGRDGRRSKRRSRSRDSNRRHSRRHRDSVDPEDAYRGSGGDFYRGGGRARSRSRSPNGDRYYRPGGRSRRDEDDSHRDRSPRRDRNSARKRSPSTKPKSPTPQPTEDERDRRTVFVQQLAARLRTKELIQFFEKVGPVKEAQIVKDRVSGRSKGYARLMFRRAKLMVDSVGYVEFKQEESVAPAIQLTGQKLLGIPIIAQLTEAEKNRQARNPEATNSNPNQIPFHRLYVGNIHFSITESDLQNVFEPFGELEFVQLQKEEQGRSRGYGFVQSVLPNPPHSSPTNVSPRFRDPNQAREALEKMNGFDLAGRPIRVGLGNDKFTPESTANLLQRFQGQEHQRNYQGSAFSGHGGRGAQAGGGGGAFDRAGGRDNEKGGGGASALDDTDVAGVNFNNYSRDALMRKLARTDDPTPETNAADQKRHAPKPKAENKPLPVSVNQASRCVLLRNMFNPAE